MIRDVPEIVTIFCATANAADVLVASNVRGRGIVGVIDGESARDIETDADRKERLSLLRKIGYKLG